MKGELIMDQIYSLMKLFGERYIFCDDDQAAMDLDYREELVSAYAAIMNFAAAKVDMEAV